MATKLEPRGLSANELKRLKNSKPIKFAKTTPDKTYQRNAPVVLFLINKNIGNDSNAIINAGNKNTKNITNGIVSPGAHNAVFSGRIFGVFL